MLPSNIGRDTPAPPTSPRLPTISASPMPQGIVAVPATEDRMGAGNYAIDHARMNALIASLGPVPAAPPLDLSALIARVQFDRVGFDFGNPVPDFELFRADLGHGLDAISIDSVVIAVPAGPAGLDSNSPLKTHQPAA